MALHRLAFIFLCLPLMASAAPFTSPGDRDLIRDRQQRLLDEQRKRLEELQQLPGKGAPAAADASGDDERCFEIRRIELEGAGHLGESARRQLLAPYQGRCLGVGQLNALLYGGRLVIVPQWVSRSPEDFYRLLCREGVTV
ncbi:POTRA domain-containing protein, partial [Pseudomonas aeruginosa]|uniref:POTRA domain-containing protein n=1 Tax=Pseudomonas aeruginosa TaxID=287 RepID=UPI000A7CF053